MATATASDEPGGGSASQLPWQSIPRFQPGVSNVQEYSQKLKFLAQMWPKEHLPLLAPRAAMMVEGSAFKLVASLDPKKLKSSDDSGVQLLVETIGGNWGATDFEERYEYFERSLYGTIQKPDESHDSYLSRMEANFNELIQRQTSLEEVRAYVLLRQSSLSAEDKKKILLEHGGKLSYRQVVSSYRLLGSKFFQEVQSGRPAQKTKVYDVNFVEEPDSSGPTMDPPEKVIMLTQEDHDPELDTEFLEAMVAMEDQDALTISAFESELEEFLQDTPELFEAFVSYQEARQKLLDKKRNRGFWPPRGGKKGFKGRGKGGKGHRREQLLARIARSSCRHCGEKGHWRAECPQRLKESSGTNAAANVAQSEVTEIPSTELLVPSEHDEIFTEEELRLAEAMGCESQFSSECLSSSKVTQNESTVSPLHNSVADALMSMSLGVTKIFGFNRRKFRS